MKQPPLMVHASPRQNRQWTRVFSRMPPYTLPDAYPPIRRWTLVDSDRPAYDPDHSDLSAGPSGGDVDADGRFTFTGVTPGRTG
jgi:hypothetical protein